MAVAICGVNNREKNMDIKDRIIEEELIDDMKLEDAESLVQEMTFEGDEGEDCDLFLDDLTDWLDNPFPGTDLRFYDKDELGR